MRTRENSKRHTEDKINTKEKGCEDKKKAVIKSKFDQKKEDSKWKRNVRDTTTMARINSKKRKSDRDGVEENVDEKWKLVEKLPRGEERLPRGELGRENALLSWEEHLMLSSCPE